jgi:macrodomain Ter protein organizer (MatP/YcbG family)
LETEQTQKTPRQFLDVAFAIDYELWEEVTKRMRKKQLTLSETVTNALKQYLKIK